MSETVCELLADSAGLRLLPADVQVKTSSASRAKWSFRPVLGNVVRVRYLMLEQILAGRHFGRVLEIGYGSGVYLPHLAQMTDELHGIDPHQKNQEVSEVLNRFGVIANLVSGSATSLPYPDQFFDSVLAVSALELIDDLPAACVEISRVLRPTGMLAVVTPGDSKMLGLGLKLLNGASARDNSGRRRVNIIPTLREHFGVRKQIDRPRYLHRMVRLYTAFELRPMLRGSVKRQPDQQTATDLSTPTC